LNETAIAEPVEADSAKQVAALVYTSGTTGNPKGVMLTHRNLLFVARSSGIVRSLGPDDRLCGVLPVSYIVSLASGVLSPLLHGATLYLYRRFDPAEVLAALEKERLTVMMGVPAMFALLLEYAKHNGLQSVSLPALRIISVSGAPLDLAMKLATERLFGLPLHHGYGITECSPTISLTPIERRRVDCSVGRVLPGVEVRLVGTDGAPVTEGNVGELWVRGPNVMKGYYKAPEQTAAAINAEGWFKSRDLARFDDGNLFIIGRNDELIIRFGFNVYPAEIEAVLNTHPAVTQSAVIGRRVNDGNEEIVAFVQSEPGSPITIAELGDYLSQQLASYKQPSEIFLVSAMPASPTGKILKNKLASMVAEAHTR